MDSTQWPHAVPTGTVSDRHQHINLSVALYLFDDARLVNRHATRADRGRPVGGCSSFAMHEHTECELAARMSMGHWKGARGRRPALEGWLASHPRGRCHHMPTSGSWLNRVEGFSAFPIRVAVHVQRRSGQRGADLVRHLPSDGRLRRFATAWGHDYPFEGKYVLAAGACSRDYSTVNYGVHFEKSPRWGRGRRWE